MGVHRFLTPPQDVENILGLVSKRGHPLEAQEGRRAFDRVHSPENPVQQIRVRRAGLERHQVALELLNKFARLNQVVVEDVLQEIEIVVGLFWHCLSRFTLGIEPNSCVSGTSNFAQDCVHVGLCFGAFVRLLHSHVFPDTLLPEHGVRAGLP